MPKLKTKSGCKKRMKLTASGKVKHQRAGKRHNMIKHAAKRNRNRRGTRVLSASDTPRIVNIFMPYGGGL